MKTVTTINFRKNGIISIERNLFTELRLKNIDFLNTFPHSLSHYHAFVIVCRTVFSGRLLLLFESNLFEYCR